MLADSYEIVEEIGRGGMATVYLATQKSLNRQVALKVLTHTTDPDSSGRFLREARVIASLNHRHVVTIYDVGVEQDRHYIVMEYVTGGDLKTRISQGMPVPIALRIIDSIASALQAAHEKGIIHRDVKPGNILFRDDGTPLLSDFGVAKQADASTLATRTGAILGTPAYLSPEQAHDTPLDGRADMYSLGIVLYEMLTGERPYQGDSDISTIFKHAYDPLPTLPEEYDYLQSFLNKLLAKDREDRFEDMAAMRSALRAAVRPGPSARRPGGAAPPPASPESTPRGVRRLGNVWSSLLSYKFGAAAGVLAAAVIVILLMYPGAGDEPAENDTALRAAEAPSGDPAQPSADDEQMAAGGQKSEPGDPGPVETEEVWARSGTKERSTPGVTSRVDELVEAGNARLAENNIISPKEDSALYYFRLADGLDPGDPEVRKGLYQVASHYAVLAHRHIKQGRYTQAERLINSGLRTSPGHPRLRALRRRVKLHHASQKAKRASRDVLNSLEDFADGVVDKIQENTGRR